MSRQHLSWWQLSISAIYQLLLTQFWLNFLDPIFLEACIYLDPKKYGPNFIWTKILVDNNFFVLIFPPNYLLNPKIFTKLSGPNIFGGLNLFGPKVTLSKFHLDQNIVGPKFFWNNFFFLPIFNPKFVRTQNWSAPKNFWAPNLLDPIYSLFDFFLPKIVLDRVFFWTRHFFGVKNFLVSKFFGVKFFGPNFFGSRYLF